MRALLGWVVLLAAVAVTVACGGQCRVFLSSGLVVGCGDEPPGPGDPNFGDAAEILVTDCNSGQLLWVGINTPPTPTPVPGGGGEPAVNTFDELEALRCSGRLNWIGGTVDVATDEPNGFFFDPNDIVVFENAPAEMQTTIAQISTDPEFYTPMGAGGQAQWVVPAAVLDIETSSTLACGLAPACPTPSG